MREALGKRAGATKIWQMDFWVPVESPAHSKSLGRTKIAYQSKKGLQSLSDLNPHFT